ncbi:MAG TPA: hypothetical protein VE462_04525 [Propionibacteriaceae bacterium]|nr:hypothetical protein [Propionibacteriaceae bacterium]
MFWALALILIAAAAFSVGVALLPRRVGGSRTSDPVQLRGFLYVGAGALALLAVAVIILGVTRSHSGVAEALAVLGFFGYALYLCAAALIIVLGRQRG